MNKKSRKKTVFLALFSFGLIVFVFLSTYIYVDNSRNREVSRVVRDVSRSADNDTVGKVATNNVSLSSSGKISTAKTDKKTTKVADAHKPAVDVGKLSLTNEDIFAWINIPGTAVDYPVVQHPTDDEYYLKHGADGMKSSHGCPYIELSDSKTFMEFNTVIYGHNMNDGSMFASLHKYESKDFFDKNRDLYVYTTEHTLKYKIFAAVMFNDRHIPYYYDDTILSDRTTFLQDIQKDIVAKRSIIAGDMKVTEKDKLITLSTCDKKLRSNRYLVVAKLITIDGQDVG